MATYSLLDTYEIGTPELPCPVIVYDFADLAPAAQLEAVDALNGTYIFDDDDDDFLPAIELGVNATVETVQRGCDDNIVTFDASGRMYYYGESDRRYAHIIDTRGRREMYSFHDLLDDARSEATVWMSDHGYFPSDRLPDTISEDEARAIANRAGLIFTVRGTDAIRRDDAAVRLCVGDSWADLIF